MKFKLILFLLFLLILMFLISGCGSTTNNEVGQSGSGKVSEVGQSGSGKVSDFLSDQECRVGFECMEEYPICIVNKCAKPNDDLKNWIQANYETENCDSIPCENCENGVLRRASVVSKIDDVDFEVSFCKECNLFGSLSKCKEGYTCELSKCVLS